MKPTLRSSRFRRVMEKMTIRDEAGRLVPCTFVESQEIMWRQISPYLDSGEMLRAIVLKARQVYCLDPLTRVLTADLRWIPLQDLLVGQEVVAVDETRPMGRGKSRKMRTARVEGFRETIAPAFQLELSDGKKLIATGEHRFLTTRAGRTCWRPVKELRPGQSLRAIVDPWPEGSFEDEWFGGLTDGEGCLTIQSGARLSVSQVPGRVLERARKYLAERGYHVGTNVDLRTAGDSSVRLVLSRMRELFRLLGQTRPERFLCRRWWEGKDLPDGESGESWPTIVSITSLGPRRMLDMQTSERSFIAEGIVSHNSTTFFEDLFFVRTIAQPNTQSVVIAHDLFSAGEIFGMVKRFYEHLPLPRFKPSKVKEIEFPFPKGSSKFKVVSAGSVAKGRGITASCLHASEVAFWPYSDVATGLFQAIPDLPNTMVVLESTANGMVGDGELFYQYWKSAVDGRSGFIPIFIPWFTMKKYRMDPAVPEGEWDEDEKILVEEFGNQGVDGHALAWRRWVIETKCHGQLDEFHQEYPSSPQEAFLTSGLPAFDYRAVLRQNRHVKPPLRVGTMSDSRFLPASKGWMKIWKEPESNHQYVVGVDTAEGIKGGDYACAQIVDMESLEQVAIIWGSISPWEMASQLVQAASWYNKALVAVEITGTGHAVQDYLIRKYAYPNLHLWRGKPDQVRPNVGRLYGWECLSPDSRVLRSDLRWIPVRDVQVGDRLIGCEETPASGYGKRRALQHQTVSSIQHFFAPRIEVQFEDGRTTTVSDNHLFLGTRTSSPKSKREEWLEAKTLRVGDSVRSLPEWGDLRSYEAGRLSAFLDGEGHLSQGVRHGIQLLVTQAEGALADEIRHLWDELGFEAVFKWVRHKDRPREKTIMISGLVRAAGVLRALGSLRPTRLLRRFAEKVDLGRVTVRSLPVLRVTRVTKLDEGPVVGLTTTPGHTLIADGLVGHNTNIYSRPLMIEAGRLAINTGLAIIHDESTLEEISQFSRNDEGKYEAEEGHDDRVIALLIALVSRSQNYVGAPRRAFQNADYSEEMTYPTGVRVITAADAERLTRRKIQDALTDRAERAVKNWMSY